MRKGRKCCSKKARALAPSEMLEALAARQGSRNEMPNALGSAGGVCCADIGLQLKRNALYACRWSSSLQPAISAHATGAYWLPPISSGQARRGYGTTRGYGRCGRAAGDVRCGRTTRAANAPNGASDRATAITQNAAAYRLMPRASVSASRANQLPVRIA